jgi:hypothetical protein
MELNRFKQLIESKLGDSRPLISEQKGYTVQGESFTLENSSDKTMPELKLFKGATFNKVGENLVANTRFQFVDSLNGLVTAGSDTISTVDDESIGKYTITGKVTYYCKLGKFTADKSKYQYFDESDGQYLVKMLKPLCQSSGVVKSSGTTTSNHICDTDKTNSKVHIGKSYKYCKNGENYYFIGTSPEIKTKYPSWTQATGKGLESIKTNIFYK